MLTHNTHTHTHTRAHTHTHTHTQLSVLESALAESEEQCSGREKELAASREHCGMLEAQLATAQDTVLDLERSKEVSESTSSERLAQITQLQRRLDEQRVHEGLVRELRERVQTLEEQLTRLRSEVGWGEQLLIVVFIPCEGLRKVM